MNDQWEIEFKDGAPNGSSTLNCPCCGSPTVLCADNQAQEDQWVNGVHRGTVRLKIKCSRCRLQMWGKAGEGNMLIEMWNNYSKLKYEDLQSICDTCKELKLYEATRGTGV